MEIISIVAYCQCHHLVRVARTAEVSVLWGQEEPPLMNRLSLGQREKETLLFIL